ncbi:protein FAR-RED ELONGATED HYPOCOTYL 3-like [Camellia sinensis]|uniref:protein FAR-RED ELONGATED HYPOCOTYL 3-like n=1 Tax=Camellia sinensis TaxID=4442 RepID=UPI001036E584|nr:protein FAR-RED ELONGATED HYPOCOTYL 3-like [Camellia sinensis]
MEIDSNSSENPLLNESEEVEEPKRVCKTQVIGDDGELRYFGLECSQSWKRIKKSEVNPLKPSLSTKISCKARRRLEINDQAGIGVSGNYNSMVVEARGYKSLTFDKRDARYYIKRARKLRLGEGDSDALQKYFLRMHAQNSSFYYMIDVDTNFHIRNLFWADAMSQAAYKEFGDVISFDTTYLTNKYDMPFAPFVGVNHHRQSILLGCGLLSSEDTDTFKILEKLKGYSQYESMKVDLQNAVYDTFTKDEFGMKWKEMIAKFNLYENQWLGVLYDEQHRWVPRKDLDRGYTCIKTTYTGFGGDFNAKVYDKMNIKLIGIVQFAGNSEEKIKIIDHGLDEIKARVMKNDEGGWNNVAPSTSNVPHITSNVPSSPIGSINRKGISHTKLLSLLVAR